MTCNPFASAALRYSPTVLRPEDLNIQDFQDVINFDLNPVNRFNREKLNTGVKTLNDILKRTDLSNLTILNEKIKQAPINKVELAEFLELSGLSVENFQQILDNENKRRENITGSTPTIKGALTSFNLLDYPRENSPGIYKKLPCAVDGVQRNIVGLCKANVNDDGSFTGVIVSDSNNNSLVQQVGYNTGIASGNSSANLNALTSQSGANVEGVGGIPSSGAFTSQVGSGTVNGSGAAVTPVSGADSLIQQVSYEMTGFITGIQGIVGVKKVVGTVRKDVSGRIIVSGVILDANIKRGSVIFDGQFSVSEQGAGSGATFNVIIGNNGLPLINVVNPGSDYQRGDILVIDGVNIRIEVVETVSLVNVIEPAFPDAPPSATFPVIPISDFSTPTTPTTPPTGQLVPTEPFTPVPGVPVDPNILPVPPVPVVDQIPTTPPAPPPPPIDPALLIPDSESSNFAGQTNQGFAPAQPFIDLVNSFNNYLDDSFGSSVTSGSCGSFNLGILGELFNLFSSLNEFVVQASDLSQEIWNSAQEFVTSLPSLLNVLQETFMELIDSLMNQARQTLERLASSISSLGSAIYALGKEIVNLVNFFSEENGQQIKNLVNSVMQNMNDQFNNPVLAIIEWILTRLCQLSDFINQFLSSPIEAVTSLITDTQSVYNAQTAISTANVAAATTAGVVRLSPEQLRAEAAAAAERSNQAGLAGGDPASSTPPRITPFPISDADLAEVRSVVTESGWPGIFTFAPSVTNNNIDANGSELPGAGWKVIVRDNPALFAKIKKVIESVGGGPYVITSAFRSEEYNRRLRENGGGAALRSAHTEAAALDIVMSSSQAIRFVPVASANDFNGIAYYVGDGFLHVDLRTWRTSPGNRSWNVNSLSGELRNVINNHQNQLYRR